jgi:hypothetical protein
MAEFTLEPTPDQVADDGHQWGYVINRNGRPVLHVWTGGTGECWNFTHPDDDELDDQYHCCDLDELVDALTVLRQSKAHADHIARWA